MLYGSIAHKLTTVQPSFSRRVSFWLGHHMQMFSLNKVRTFAAVNRAKENKKQKTCLAREQQIALRWPTIVYTHLFCRELWGGCPGNPAHRGCSTQYRIVKRVSVHVCMHLPHITTTCASLILQSPRVQIIIVDLHTLFTQQLIDPDTTQEFSCWAVLTNEFPAAFISSKEARELGRPISDWMQWLSVYRNE